MRIRYVGRHTAVEIAATGAVVEYGDVVDVPAELAKSLLTQGDQWKKAATKKSGATSASSKG